VKELTGMTASTGTATGKVKVCSTIESLKKVEEGDIIVAPMTRPEYVPAMRKAAAIITDEGGITCHAAIVSRELNIPCIIGTKIATKVLNDGDLVEIKGNHGLIIILKKA
jgi:pyruvate,water dikinase